VDFQKGGLGNKVVALAPDTPAGGRLSAGYGTVMFMNNAPHPNAAKIFINWLLSKEGSTAWSRVVEKYMARVDVPGPEHATTSGRTDPNKDYISEINHEKNAAVQAKMQVLYKEIVMKNR
jgi:iron(III) transport system substrate-binding protein